MKLSFIIEADDKIIGFLVGFMSQDKSDEAYIHFVGVHPDYRNRRIAKRLYERFFMVVVHSGCRVVRCITSPINRTSIAFHKKMGFVIEAGDKMIDGVAVHTGHDGSGNDRVLFTKNIENDGDYGGM
ncbi:GNAT family N-acetyltransferase [Bacillus sp. A301a_S52]|nr:GNAT family N-acetyltransferase [Bacillus sp. A301a_S52]